MKYFSILVFFIFICLPVTALANPLPSPSQCLPGCFVQCFDCATGKISNDSNCSYCRTCRKTELQSQCPTIPTRPIADPTPADPTPARPIELPNNDKDDDDSSACSASPYAPTPAPVTMLLLSLLMLGLAIPARKQ